MLDDVLPFLRCPICHNELALTRAALRCGSGHCFDIARQGYVSLLPAGRARAAGDTAEMVRARRDFLAAGHYAGLAQEVASLAAEVTGRPASGELDEAAALAGREPPGQPGRQPPSHQPPGRQPPSHQPRGCPACVVDVGAGTGYYLAAVLDRLPGRYGIAADASKFALRLAARAHPRAAAVGCDAWRALPIADNAADLVLNTFAPRDGAELGRILRPAGHLIVVTPQPDHLAELTGQLGLLSVDRRKDERLAGTLGQRFVPAGTRTYRAALALDHEAVTALVAMGPSARHLDRADLAARIGKLADPAPITLAVTLSVFRPAGPAPCAGDGQ